MNLKSIQIRDENFSHQIRHIFNENLESLQVKSVKILYRRDK